MDSGTNGLLFFYGFFWALAMSNAGRFAAFDTASIAVTGQTGRVLRRFISGVLILVIFPIGMLLLLHECWVSASDSMGAIANAALSSISVFAFVRIFHAVAASNPTYRYFYSKEQIDEIRERGVLYKEQSQSFLAHFVPGVLYLLVPPALGKLLQCWLP